MQMCIRDSYSDDEQTVTCYADGLKKLCDDSTVSAGDCITLAPVSYTHLDVYKRQAYITDFQKYVSDNKVSSNDFKSIDTWIQREKPEFRCV